MGLMVTHPNLSIVIPSLFLIQIVGNKINITTFFVNLINLMCIMIKKTKMI